MPFLFLGILFVLIGLFVDKPRRSVSATGVGLLLVYAFLTYVE